MQWAKDSKDSAQASYKCTSPTPVTLDLHTTYTNISADVSSPVTCDGTGRQVSADMQEDFPWLAGSTIAYQANLITNKQTFSQQSGSFTVGTASDHSNQKTFGITSVSVFGLLVTANGNCVDLPGVTWSVAFTAVYNGTSYIVSSPPPIDCNGRSGHAQGVIQGSTGFPSQATITLNYIMTKSDGAAGPSLSTDVTEP